MGYWNNRIAWTTDNNWHNCHVVSTSTLDITEFQINTVQDWVSKAYHRRLHITVGRMIIRSEFELKRNQERPPLDFRVRFSGKLPQRSIKSMSPSNLIEIDNQTGNIFYQVNELIMHPKIDRLSEAIQNFPDYSKSTETEILYIFSVLIF